MFNRSKLTEEGRPLKPSSIFIGIKRKNLPSQESISECVRIGTALGIPYSWVFGKEELLYGKVSQVRIFRDGTLVLIEVNTLISRLKWPVAPLWIPRNPHETAGVLN